MNGIKCYLSRQEIRKIIAEEIARRLQPERLLGPCRNDAQFFDDGRIEVTFWTQDAVLVEDAKAPEPASAPAAAPAAPSAASPPDTSTRAAKSPLHSLLRRESKV